jgi:glucose/arabinose dehydrogenase
MMMQSGFIVRIASFAGNAHHCQGGTMKSRMILAASIALAFAAPAFAQDSQTPPPAPPADQAAPADSQPMTADVQPPATKPHRAKHHRASGHSNANMALTGNEPRIVAYQESPGMKSYPAVDPGHVPGDPPVIDHNADQAGVPPTTTTITVPPPTH